MNEKEKGYMGLARIAAKGSTCIRHPIGAILVTRKGFIIYGNNGGPGAITCDEMFGDCPRTQAGAKSGEKMELCIAVHAERRPLLYAAHNGVSTEGSTLYAWCGIPCKDCMIELIEAGVQRIVCLDDDKFERVTPTIYNFGRSLELARAAGVEIIMVKESEV